MLVFISWSGDRSKALASALSSWLPQVIQAVDPWLSTGISKGGRWSPRIAEALEQARVGIVCLTTENLHSPWINFEAGALSKSSAAHVCTLLLDLNPTDVPQPLGQFQHTALRIEEMFQLVETINGEIAIAKERALDPLLLRSCFDTNWPNFERAVHDIMEQKPVQPVVKPSEYDVLSMILEEIRGQSDVLARIEQVTLLFESRGAAVAHDADRQESKIRDEYRWLQQSVADNIKATVENGQLALKFQPIFDLKSTKPVKFKVFTEFTRPELASLEEEGVLRIARDFHLREEIDLLLIDNVVRQLAIWQESPLIPLPLQITLSPAGQGYSRLRDHLVERCRIRGVSPALIQVAIEETQIEMAPSAARKLFSDLHAAGFKTAISQFGSGTSTLSFLRHLPVDCVMIDASITRDCVDSSVTRTLLEAIAAVFRSLIVPEAAAEGVDSDAHLAIVRSAGIPLASGAYFGGPIAPDDCVSYLKKS